jgi:hypothetical protein
MIIRCVGHTGRSRMARSREPWTTPRQCSMPSPDSVWCFQAAERTLSNN